MLVRFILFFAILAAPISLVFCQAENFKRLPPAGKPLDPKISQPLAERSSKLRTRLTKLQDAGTSASDIANVAVLLRAVDLALEQDLFYRPSDTKNAAKLFDEADRRLSALESGLTGWDVLLPKPLTELVPIQQPISVAVGYVSRIDGSTQPIGLDLPIGFDPNRSEPYRLDVWLHGRGDDSTEMPFLVKRSTQMGDTMPGEAIVLHPFGRHCVAFKFAGETDVYEAIDRTAALVSIDRQRIAMRGFSMGGAGVWHLSVHDPARWFAVNPGAGFVDTLIYQKWVDQPPFPVDEVQQKLLSWYDVLPWTNNLRNTRVVAYSGEVDPQRQAAEMVIAEANRLSIPAMHVIGKEMGHKVDPPSAQIIAKQLSKWAGEVKVSETRPVDFTTFTTRYSTSDWLTVSGLSQHWTEARVKGQLDPAGRIGMIVTGVTHLDLNVIDPPWGDDRAKVQIIINRQPIDVVDADPAPGFQCHLVDRDGWQTVGRPDMSVRKRPGLQGPIDDAFCESFLFVLPSRPAKHGVVQRWIERELKYAQERWVRLMRGELRVVLDKDLTPQQIAENHLICFGDFTGNDYLQQIAPRLPINWNMESIVVDQDEFDAKHHAPVLCYPNPESPSRYVVVNSGMTFREFSNTSNSRQIAMLPDWAVIDCREGDDSMFPGPVVAKGFFNESWQF